MGWRAGEKEGEGAPGVAAVDGAVAPAIPVAQPSPNTNNEAIKFD